MEVIQVELPLREETIKKLRAGNRVFLTGKMYTARDAAHQRLFTLINENKPLPFELRGQTIYYVGPTPARPGKIIGSAGPTTSGRMDSYTPLLIEKGLRGMVGKGSRSIAVKDAIMKYGCVYFAAIGGAAALISKSIKDSRVIAFEELGPEAIRELTVENFPAVIINDCYGNDWYEDGQKIYRQGNAINSSISVLDRVDEIDNY